MQAPNTAPGGRESSELTPTDGPISDYWSRRLNGSGRGTFASRGVWARMPAAPRCKICRAPFEGWGGVVSRLFGRRRAVDSKLVCSRCLKKLDRHPGGGMVDVSALCAELRGPLSPDPTARRAVNRFHRLASELIDRAGGLLSESPGGKVEAFFLASIAGGDHADVVITVTRELFLLAKEAGLAEAGFRLSAGVHTDSAYAGVVRNAGHLDFALVGGSVDIPERLASAATSGEVLVSMGSWRRQGGRFAKSRLRSVPVPGKLRPVEAVIIRGDMEAAI